MNGLIKQRMRFHLLVFFTVLQVTLLASAQVKNPGFEDKQNKAWKGDSLPPPEKQLEKNLSYERSPMTIVMAILETAMREVAMLKILLGSSSILYTILIR